MDFIGGNESPNKVATNKTYTSEQILEPIESIVQDVNSQEYAFIAIEMGEQIPTKEQRIQEFQLDQIKQNQNYNNKNKLKNNSHKGYQSYNHKNK